MFVILDGFQQTLLVKALLCLEVLYNLLVQKVWPLDYLAELTVLCSCLAALSLNVWWAHEECLSLWFVQLIPRMLSDLSNRNSLVRICLEDFCDHIFCFVREEVREGVLGVQDLLVEIRRLLVFIRQEPTQHRIQNDTHAPQITCKAVIVVSSNHLWSCIARRSTSRFKRCSWLIHV